uniref:G_PROTEIN_RECEP_F1_2 domain-containing protein n=1 Tax=Panagrellus redivivus TaxID=6233 RepID=A0A7E4W7N6_PANRE
MDPHNDSFYGINGVNLANATVWKNFMWRNHTQQCILIQSDLPEKVDHTGFQMLFSALYFLVWLSAIFGNLCVIYVVTLKQITLSTVRSVFICSLAISDILMCLTSLPITAISIFTRDWVFPNFFCKLMGVFQGGSVFISSFTMTAIAADRFILIRHPGSEIINFTRAVIIVILIWVLGYSFALPLGVFSVTQDFESNVPLPKSADAYVPLCGLFCEERWPDTDITGFSKIRKIYGVSVLLIQFGVPVLISSVCYLLIGRIINKQIEKRKKQQVLLEENQHRLDSRKSRSSRMMVAMVGGLVLAWLPMNLINLWRDFSTPDKVSQWYSLVFAGCHVVAMTSAVWNPIIYSWFNPQFRDTVRKALRRRSPSQYGSMLKSPASVARATSFRQGCKGDKSTKSTGNVLL